MKEFVFEAMTQRKVLKSKVSAHNIYEAIGIIYAYFQSDDGNSSSDILNKRYVKINWIKEVK